MRSAFCMVILLPALIGCTSYGKIEVSSYDNAIDALEAWVINDLNATWMYGKSRDLLSKSRGSAFGTYSALGVHILNPDNMRVALEGFCVKIKGEFSSMGDRIPNGTPEHYACVRNGELLFQARDSFLGSRNVGGNVFTFDYHNIELVEVYRGVEGYQLARKLGYMGPDSDSETSKRQDDNEFLRKKIEEEKLAKQLQNQMDREKLNRELPIIRNPGTRLCKNVVHGPTGKTATIVANTEKVSGSNILVRVAGTKPYFTHPIVVNDNEIKPGAIIWDDLLGWRLCD